jgi:uncharacterized protein
MAGTSLIALIDDIATVLDDISILTKVAARKTAGVLGDDLALNAEQVTGVRAERELPVVWAVAKGSLVNKAILVPAALAISAVAPWLILPLLMLGGAFLCYEGFEKLAHKLLHSRSEDSAHHAELTAALADPGVDLAVLEQSRIKGAVRTDFVLSAEIIVITLGIVAGAPFGTQVAVLAGIGFIMTVGVYGLVAGIVKLDDLGLYLSRREGSGAGPQSLRWLGERVLLAAPWLMKLLSVVGTAAMFLVGGGIITHGIPGAHDVIHHVAESAGTVPTVGGALAGLTPLALDGLAGILVGALVLGAVTLVTKVWKAALPDRA